MGNVDATKKLQVLQGSRQSEEMDPQEFATLLELYDTSFRNIAEGEVVKGTVVKVTPTEIIVDVGFKSEGIIPIEESIDRKSTRPNSSHGYRTHAGSRWKK